MGVTSARFWSRITALGISATVGSQFLRCAQAGFVHAKILQILWEYKYLVYMEYPKAITGTPEPVSKASTNTETVKKDMFWSLKKSSHSLVVDDLVVINLWQLSVHIRRNMFVLNLGNIILLWQLSLPLLWHQNESRCAGLWECVVALDLGDIPAPASTRSSTRGAHPHIKAPTSLPVPQLSPPSLSCWRQDSAVLLCAAKFTMRPSTDRLLFTNCGSTFLLLVI